MRSNVMGEGAEKVKPLFKDKLRFLAGGPFLLLLFLDDDESLTAAAYSATTA